MHRFLVPSPRVIALASLLALTYATPALADEDVQMVEGSTTDINTWSFDPPFVTIQAGQSVTWINNGVQTHTATAANGSFDTGMIEPNQSKTVALAAPGTYEYACTPHPWMKGTINVTAAAAQPAPTPAPAPTTAPAAAVPVAKPAVQPAATPTPFRLVTTTTTTTPAPRAGSLPMDMAVSLLAGGVAVAGAGVVLLRRRKSS